MELLEGTHLKWGGGRLCRERHLQRRRSSLGFMTSHTVIRNDRSGAPRLENALRAADALQRLALEGSSGEGRQHSALRGALTAMEKGRGNERCGDAGECVPAGHNGTEVFTQRGPLPRYLTRCIT